MKKAKKIASVYIMDDLIRKEFGDLDKILKENYNDYYEFMTKKKSANSCFILHENMQNENFSFKDVFQEIITIDFEFAKGLKLFDCIHSECFTHSTQLGKQFLDFLNGWCDSITFHVYMIQYYSLYHIDICFKIGYDDYYTDHKILTKIQL
jgi:hypothetical protein